MKKTTKWTIAVATVLMAGGLTFAVPALAQGNALNPQAMMANGVAGMMGGNMMAMHNAMAPLMSQMPKMHDQAMGEVAKLLGITGEELNAALADRSLADLAVEKGIAPADIQAVMTTQMQTFVKQAVADGTLTQEQADQVLKLHEQNSANCLSGGMMGGDGGMMGRMMGGMH